MTVAEQARVLTWDRLAEGMAATVDFAVTPAEMRAFAALSGDYNALHHDPAFARGKGFDGVVVYGGLIVAKISQLIGMKLPGRDAVWMGLSLRFRKPLYVGQQARLEGTITRLSDATRVVGLRIEVSSAGQLLAEGDVEALVVQP
jgi:acyl dehydratase